MPHQPLTTIQELIDDKKQRNTDIEEKPRKGWQVSLFRKANNRTYTYSIPDSFDMNQHITPFMLQNICKRLGLDPRDYGVSLRV